jgi:hypothetical protein
VNRTGTYLLLLLLAQLGWLGYLYNQERAAGGASVSARLADIGPFHIDELYIDDSRDNRVRLVRERNGWIVPGLGDLPADGERVAMLLEQLTGEDPGWAVAHTLAARQRFRVADYHFRRRIRLLAQDAPVATVFLGTSPSFRKVHARNADDDAIYSISLNLFDLPARQDGWLDAGLLELKAPLRIAADGYSLDRSSGEWRLGDGSRPDARELAALLDALQGLQVSGVADAALAGSLGTGEAALILQVESLSGTDTLSLHQKGDRYLVHSARWQQYFLVSAYTFDTLTGIDAMLMSATTEGD